MKKFYLAVLMAALISLTACGADRGSDSVQHSINGVGGAGSGIIWETIPPLQPSDNENGFILTAKQTERVSESD